MEEIWVQLAEFPNYSISSEGRVRNDVRGRIVRTSLTRQGAAKVGLIRGGVQETRSVKVLVAEHFVDGWSETFNTPINLDGDQTNNNVDNIVWRPRWFACKYKSQFYKIEMYSGVGPIVDRKTGIIYKDVVDAALSNGVLFYEIQMSLVNKVPIFPTWHIFDWVRESNI